jgi:membrane protease YdiL (CAAX protease family)
MNDNFIEFFVIIGLGYFVYFFTDRLKFTRNEYPFSNVRKSAIAALIALFVGWVGISGLLFLVSTMGFAGGTHQEFGLWNVIRQVLLYCIFLGPILIVMRRRLETLSSAGTTKHNLGKSILLGVILSAFMFLFHMVTKRLEAGEMLRSISLSDFWAFLTFLVVGFSEEFAFRGYLQTRLMGWLGTLWGWVMASALMAVGHIIQRITIMGMSGMDAIFSSLSLIPISLLYGFILLRTENIAGGTILHTFVDWSSVLYFT